MVVKRVCIGLFTLVLISVLGVTSSQAASSHPLVGKVVHVAYAQSNLRGERGVVTYADAGVFIFRRTDKWDGRAWAKEKKKDVRTLVIPWSRVKYLSVKKK